jgi:uncharacterized membrane protein YfcA
MDSNLYIISGFVVGIIVGITGVGGGSLMTPLLILFFGIPPAIAVGTDLLYASITKSLGAWVHAKNGYVNWRYVFLLACGSITATIMTIYGVSYYALSTEATSDVIKTTLGFVLTLTAITIIFRNQLRQATQEYFNIGNNAAPEKWIILTGALLGVLVYLSSSGAGALGLTALMILAPSLSTSKLVGTDIAYAVPVTLVAGLAYAFDDLVDWGLLLSLLIGSLPGIWLGSQVSHHLPEFLLRGLLATVLLIISGILVY